MLRIKKGTFASLIILSIGIGLLVGSLWTEYNLTPVKATEAAAGNGVQIDYKNGGGYWLEYEEEKEV